MAGNKKGVEIALEDAVCALRDLNEYVVSLDRIASRIDIDGRNPDVLLKYMTNRDVFRRLAHLRSVLVDALELVVGEEEVERISEESYIFTDE